jgi:AbiV family abortive infection protein
MTKRPEKSEIRKKMFSANSQEEIIDELCSLFRSTGLDAESAMEYVRRSVETIIKKRGIERFEKHCEVLFDLLHSGKALVKGSSLQEEEQQFNRLSRHVERLWDDSCKLLLAGSFPNALFLSLVCIEEAGKIGVAYFQILINDSIRNSGSKPKYQETAAKSAKKKNSFYSHTKKHWLAAGSGAIVNSRLDGKLGISAIIKFLDDVENGEIEKLRQSCLYADHDGKNPIIPHERIRKETARFYVVLAGELLANILGIGSESYRLIQKVNEFEETIGCP